MKLGFGLPVAGAWARPDVQLEVASLAEEAGYSTLWTFQRLLFPKEPQDHYPPLPDQPWPVAFRKTVDSTVSLAFVAGVTSKIRLGFGLLNAPFYSPALLAKQVGSLDFLSRGRVTLGLGLGWSRDEFDAVGIPFKGRGARMNEFIDCLRSIWTNDEVAFKGSYYSYPPARMAPRPVQRPHPPIFIGGYGPPAIERTVLRGDGFIGGNVPLRELQPLVDELHERAEQAGRDPSGLAVVCRGSVVVHKNDQGPDRRPLRGSVSEIWKDIDCYRAAGVSELFLDGNLDPDIGGDAVGEADAVDRGLKLLQEFAPNSAA